MLSDEQMHILEKIKVPLLIFEYEGKRYVLQALVKEDCCDKTQIEFEMIKVIRMHYS